MSRYRGRVGNWRGGPLGRRLGCIRGFPLRARVAVSVAPFPAPATSHAACGFPALRAPAHFATRFMRPIRSEPLSPSATPPLPTEASAQCQDRSAFLLPYSRPDLRSCRLLDAFIIRPCLTVLTTTSCAARSLRSTGVTPLPSYYRPSRHPLAFHRFPG